MQNPFLPNGLIFSNSETAYTWIKARHPDAHVLIDCCDRRTVWAWERYSDFADNHPGVMVTIKPCQ